MNRTWLVLTREYTERIRSKAFLLSNAAILAVLLLGLSLPLLLGGNGEEPTALGVVSDEAAEVGELALAQQEAFGVELELSPLGSREAAERALEAGEVDVALLDAATLLADGTVGRGLEALLANAANTVQVDSSLAAAGLDADQRAELFAIAPLEVEQLEDDAGAVDVFDPSIIIVYGAVFLLYGLLAIYGQWVAQGIVEEKQSRVIEVLLSALKPTELLTGKVLGLGALGLSQVAVLAGIAVTGLLLTDVVDIPAAGWRALAFVVPWYVLGFLLYAALFAAAGSLVARVEDLQSATLPVIMVLILALLAVQVALADPTGTVATVAGLVPLTAPIVQPILLALGVASFTEVVLAISLALASIAVLLPLAARIYRNSVLQTRGRVTVREAWRGSDAPRTSAQP
ncbi:MAG: ABC transporter permease [Nitriliruptoraceae bacterium]